MASTAVFTSSAINTRAIANTKTTSSFGPIAESRRDEYNQGGSNVDFHIAFRLYSRQDAADRAPKCPV